MAGDELAQWRRGSATGVVPSRPGLVRLAAPRPGAAFLRQLPSHASPLAAANAAATLTPWTTDARSGTLVLSAVRALARLRSRRKSAPPAAPRGVVGVYLDELSSLALYVSLSGDTRTALGELASVP
jgi:hypothetical protein